MLSQFAEAKAAHIRIGDKLTLQEVVNQPISPIRPQDLMDRSHKLFVEISKRIND